MIKDKTKALIKITGLSESFRDFADKESIEPEESEGFLVDKHKSHFFEVLSGSMVCATGWREKSELKEVSGLVTLYKGDSCLFLPGEPRLIRVTPGSEVSEFILE